MFDVIVIGARCAGSATAMLLGRKGHRVLLLDRASFPSDVISTHFLWPHGASYLNRWGLLEQVKAVTPSFTELKLVNEGIPLTGSVPLELLEQHFRTLHSDTQGLVQTYLSVRRRVLDELLVESAAAANVDVRVGCAVERLLMDGDRVVGVACRTKDGETFEERAPIVVGADGRNSFVARSLNLPKFDSRRRCTFAYWSYFSGFTPSQGQIHRRGRLAAAVVPTNHDQNMVLVWGPGEWFESFKRDIAGNHQRTLDYVCPEIGAQVRSSTRQERFYGTADQDAYLRPLYGKGWVLAGDAECFKDQCTATGMTHAFRDAELVASAIDQAASGQGSFEDNFKIYESRRRSQSSAAYFDYVCTYAEMKPLRHDELLLFMALRSNQAETDRFIATHADIAPVADFFTSSTLFQLLEQARESTNDYPIFQNFEKASLQCRQNPFLAAATTSQENPS